MSWTFGPALRRQIVDLYQSGLTQPRVAERTGVSQGHVSKILRQEGVTTRPPGRQRTRPSRRDCDGCGKPFDVPARSDRRTCSAECRYAAAATSNSRTRDLDPATVGRRTLLAKTCQGCDEFLPAARFQRQDRGYYATNCCRCVQSGWVVCQGLPGSARVAARVETASDLLLPGSARVFAHFFVTRVEKKQKRLGRPKENFLRGVKAATIAKDPGTLADQHRIQRVTWVNAASEVPWRPWQTDRDPGRHRTSGAFRHAHNPCEGAAA